MVGMLLGMLEGVFVGILLGNVVVGLSVLPKVGEAEGMSSL